jgi:hypothetical protein
MPEAIDRLRIISVAPHFGVGAVPFGGHEEIYQLGLSRSATSLGLKWTILAPKHSVVSDASVVRCLDRSTKVTLVSSIDRYLRENCRDDEPVGVVMYEGSVAWASAIASVANAHPKVQFLVNLFRLEPGLDVPVVGGKRRDLQSEMAPFDPAVLAATLNAYSEVVWPKNFTLTAETSSKAVSARSVGLPVDATWHLHSQLSERLPMKAVVSRDYSGMHPVRVLIVLLNSHMLRPLLSEVLHVIKGVEDVGRQSTIAWSISARKDGSRQTAKALRRLERSGVHVALSDGPLSHDDYANTFLNVDVVWMPAVWPYRVQSSGKALDAITLARPIIAPAGTAASVEMQRWIPGAPSYGTPAEAIQLFLRLPTAARFLQHELLRLQEQICCEYSPNATIAWILRRFTGEPVRSSEPTDDPREQG